MDFYDISAKLTNQNKLGNLVKAGQKVKITRMLLISYETDIESILDGTDKEYISYKDLIEDEMDNNTISVEMEYSDNVDIEDNVITSVEII